MTNVVVSAGITSFSGPRLRPVAHDLLLNHQTHRVGHGLAGIARSVTSCCRLVHVLDSMVHVLERAIHALDCTIHPADYLRDVRGDRATREPPGRQ